jgi:cytidylate kinase
MPLDETQTFDADCMVAMMERITAKIAREGNAVVVGRGAPYFLRDRDDTFHVFLFAPHAEKIRRIVADGCSEKEAEELVNTVDRERIAFIKHYFNADWPTRALYHIMLNTVIGDELVIESMIDVMRRMEQKVGASPSALRGVR